MSGFASVCLIEPSLAHLDRVFTYSIPDAMAAPVGAVVRAPFRGKNRRGVVVDLLEQADVATTLPLKDVLGPGISEEGVALARWMAGRYLSTLGEALAAVTPARVADEEKKPTHAPHELTSARTSRLLDGYKNGGALERAVKSGGGSFVWRPLSIGARASTIVSLSSSVLSDGRGVLVLVPEPRGSSVVAALSAAFGDALAVLTADRTTRERYRDWLSLRRGEKHVAVGGRGAIFAPVGGLGLIVVDDEAHVAYKEARAPRFHARTIAAERARRSNATLVLAGIPPSIDAYAATSGGSFTLVAPARADERAQRTAVTVVDEHTRLVPASLTLRLAREALDRGERVVILTHRAGDDAVRIAERTVRILKPKQHGVLDATTPRAAIRRALAKADVIVATPVIAKDDIPPNVGLLAIVEADAALSQPGFRASEESFGTWWRCAGWAARIAIETENPTHPAVEALVRWDPDVLVRSEAARRKELGYPPFATVARIDVPAERAAGVAAEIGSLEGLEVLGPVTREEGAVVVARARRRDTLLAALGPVVAEWRRRDEPMRVDVDPWEVLVPKWRS